MGKREESLDETLARLQSRENGRAESQPKRARPIVWSSVPVRDQVKGQGRKQQYCRKGHEFTEENTIWTSVKNGEKQRACRTCREIWDMRAKRRSYKHLNKPIDPIPLPPNAGTRGSTFSWNYEIGRMPAVWDDPFAQIDSEIDEVLEDALNERIGARILCRESSLNEVSEIVWRLDKAIVKAGKKGFKPPVALRPLSADPVVEKLSRYENPPEKSEKAIQKWKDNLVSAETIRKRKRAQSLPRSIFNIQFLLDRYATNKVVKN